MAGNSNAEKKTIKIDITSDTTCPWCFVGKTNLDKAIAATKDQFNFEIKWHPFQINPDAPKEGVDKVPYYKTKFGSQADQIHGRVAQVFRSLGLEYNLSGLTGNTLDSHRLLYFAGLQSQEKQHNLAQELFYGYFTQSKFIGGREFLLEAASKAGIEGAAEFLNSNNGVQEVKEEIEKSSAYISGVPYYVINGRHKLSGGQPSEVFLRAFQAVTK